MPYMYNLDDIVKTSIVKLTVTEHHKVRHEYQGEGESPTLDGYVLTDEAGTIWHNQYPTASYEQLSDEGDNIYRLASEQPNCKEFKDYDVLMEELGINFIECRNLPRTMQFLSNGIMQLKELSTKNDINPNHLTRLSKAIVLYRNTLTQFEAMVPGKTIDFIPHEKHPEIFKVTKIVDKATAEYAHFNIDNYIGA